MRISTGLLIGSLALSLCLAPFDLSSVLRRGAPGAGCSSPTASQVRADELSDYPGVAEDDPSVEPPVSLETTPTDLEMSEELPDESRLELADRAALDESTGVPTDASDDRSRVDRQFDIWADELERTEPEEDTPPQTAARGSADANQTSDESGVAPWPERESPSRFSARRTSPHGPLAAWRASQRRAPREAVAVDPFADSRASARKSPRLGAVEQAQYLREPRRAPLGRESARPISHVEADSHHRAPADLAHDGGDELTHEEALETHAPPAAPPSLSAGSAGPQLSVSWQSPREISLGQQTRCELVISNHGTAEALGVQLVVELPEHAQVDLAEPAGNEQGTERFWQWDRLAPGQSQSVMLLVTPTAAEPLAPRTAVSFQQPVADEIQIVQPELSLEVAGPQQAALDERAEFVVSVTNTGRGAAGEVVVHARSSEHFQHAHGHPLTFSLGTLGAGETRTVQLPLVGTQPGHWPVEVAVTSGAAVLDRCEAECEVVRPTMTLAVEGPRRRFVDRPAVYRVTVANPGPAPVENVEVVQPVPPGFRFIEASAGGRFDAATASVAWKVGHLDGGQVSQLGLKLMPLEPGEHCLGVSAEFDGGEPISAETRTAVEGLAVLVLDVQDADDPIEVTGRTHYEIHLANRGSMTARQVEVAAVLSGELEATGTSGPVDGSMNGDRVIFGTIDALEPGESIVLRVEAHCLRSGRARFQAFVRSDDGQEPLAEDELTQVYAD